MIFPSKTFLLGEYAVLHGAPALVLAHAPHFVCKQANDGQLFPEGSPAARLADGTKFQFTDPHQGRGGFGASGAEFLGVLAHKEQQADPWHARELYFQHGGTGSGADILVQQHGMNRKESALVLLDIPNKKIRTVSAGLNLHVFHTGIKLKTHEHLSKNPTPPHGLSELCATGISALERKDILAFLQALQSFQASLAAAGFLADHSAKALKALPAGVQAAKGCGALGSDVILVIGKGLDLGAWAKEFSLTEVFNGTV